MVRAILSFFRQDGHGFFRQAMLLHPGAADPRVHVALGESSELAARQRLLDLAFAEARRTLPGHHVSCAELTLLDENGTTVATAVTLLLLVDAEPPLLS